MLADAKKYLQKNNIDLNDQNFKDLVTILQPNNLKYTYMFTLFMFEQCKSLDVLQNILNNYILKYKDSLNKLPQDIVKYRKYSQLYFDLLNLETEIFYKRFINTLPKKLSNINTEQKCLLINLVNRFYNQSENYQNDFIKNVSRFKKVDQMINDLDLHIKNVDYNLNFLKVIKKIKQQKFTRIAYQDEKILLVEVVEYCDMKKIGSNYWCITRQPESWRNYVCAYQHARQYILWNQNLDRDNPENCIAFTIKDIGNSRTRYDSVAHNRRNKSIKLHYYLKEHKLTFLYNHISLKTQEEKFTDVLDYLKSSSSLPYWFNERYNFINFKSLNYSKIEEHIKSKQIKDTTLVKFLKLNDTLILSCYDFQKLILSIYPNSLAYWKYFMNRMLSSCQKLSYIAINYKENFEIFLNKKHKKNVVKTLNITNLVNVLNKEYLKEMSNHFMTFITLNHKYISYEDANLLIASAKSKKMQKVLQELYKIKK